MEAQEFRPPDHYARVAAPYAELRRPDPRIASQVRSALQGVDSVLNVGAGNGSYEPDDLPVSAVDLSLPMLRRRHTTAPAIQARAEALPFADDAFGACLAILTLHHWADPLQGLRECARAARDRVVVLTWDPSRGDFWLTRDYFPEILEIDRRIFPPIEWIAEALGGASVTAVPVPADCTDGFLGAYWRRPERYLEATTRSSISTFSRLWDIDAGLEALRRDLESGSWKRRNSALSPLDSLDLGYRLVVAPAE